VLQLLVEEEVDDDYPQERFDEEDNNDSMIDGWMTLMLTHSLPLLRTKSIVLFIDETKEATEATDRFDNNTAATTPHKNSLLLHASS
jgi:hypothetical protein